LPEPQEIFRYPAGIDQGIVRDAAYQVADTIITFDRRTLRQLGENGEQFAAIDITRPFRYSMWIDRGVKVVQVRQGGELLLFTAILDGAQRLCRDILRTCDLDNWS
jgi:hypothetical protein